MFNGINIKSIFRIMTFIGLISVLFIGFQNCSSKKASPDSSTNDSKTEFSGTGNGSGYGGKTDGRFYNVASTNVCTSGPLAPSSVIDFIEIENGKAYYYDSCNQTQPQEVSLDEFDITETNKNIVGYQDSGNNYEFSTEVPTAANNLLPIEGVCYFTGDSNPIIELQVVVRSPQPPSIDYQTEVYYSYFTNFFQTVNYDFLSPYNSTISSDLVGDTYRSTNPSSELLVTSDQGQFLPVRPGTLRIDINGELFNLQTQVCIFPSELIL